MSMIPLLLFLLLVCLSMLTISYSYTLTSRRVSGSAVRNVRNEMRFLSKSSSVSLNLQYGSDRAYIDEIRTVPNKNKSSSLIGIIRVFVGFKNLLFRAISTITSPIRFSLRCLMDSFHTHSNATVVVEKGRDYQPAVTSTSVISAAVQKENADAGKLLMETTAMFSEKELEREKEFQIKLAKANAAAEESLERERQEARDIAAKLGYKSSASTSTLVNLSEREVCSSDYDKLNFGLATLSLFSGNEEETKQKIKAAGTVLTFILISALY